MSKFIEHVEALQKKKDKVLKYILQMIWDRSKRSKNIRMSESITSMTNSMEEGLLNHPVSEVYINNQYFGSPKNELLNKEQQELEFKCHMS